MLEIAVTKTNINVCANGLYNQFIHSVIG